MDLITSLRIRIAHGLVKAAGLPVVPPWVTASFIEPTFQALVREGYSLNAAVFACASALTFDFPEPPPVVTDVKKGETVSNHPLQLLLERPNPVMSYHELAVYTMAYMAIGGNAFWYKLRSEAGRVVQLWPYHIGQMTPVPGGVNWIQRFDYDPGDGTNTPVKVEDVVHFKWPSVDPAQPWQAQPPLKAAARETDSDNELTRYLFALLKNDAVPRTALVLPPSVVLDDKQFKRLKKQWNERYGGENRGTTAIVEGGATIQRIGLDMKELAFEALHGVPEARIASAFRVPPIIAGLNIGLTRGTFANYEEARKAYTEQTLVPLWVLAGGEMTSGLGGEFGAPVKVGLNLGSVRALREDENNRWTRVDKAVVGGYLTVNEARAALGYPEDSAGDVYLRGLNVFTETAKVKFLLPSPQYKQNPANSNGAGGRGRSSAKDAQALQRIRREVGKRMEAEVEDYFKELSNRVVTRARKGGSGRVLVGGAPVVPDRAGQTLELKLKDTELITAGDGEELEGIVKRFYRQVLEASWDTWNTALGVTLDFELTDPVVSEVLRSAGQNIRGIQDTTRESVRDLLRFGNEQGWSVDQLVRGDDEHPGLRSLVEETYHNRARNIARTELSVAQNTATHMRYESAGIRRVLVLDNGQDDPDQECAAVNGTEQTLEWAEKNPIAHPACTRAFAPIIE